jgi:thiaminase/transcriptional activator TenA
MKSAAKYGRAKMPLSTRLKEQAARTLEREHDHPFVRGLGDGTLDPECFKVWLRQDYLFLIAYSKVLALAAARAEELETMARFADLLQVTLRGEMNLHRGYAQRFDIGEADLAREEMAPTTRAYTSFLLRVAWEGPLAAVVAALLPCAWGYSEIARRLAAKGDRQGDARYREWIRTYASDEFAEYAEWLRGLLDRLAEDSAEPEQRRLAEIFLTSSRYEYLFWEMCYRRETWPV